MKAAIERKVVGQHALTLFDNRITLSKNGFTQSARRVEPVTDQFDEAVARLEAWYATHGDDFLADGKFVDHVLFNH